MRSMFDMFVSPSQSSNCSGFEFLIYFLPHLSQCVDCIIVAVTKSHTMTIKHWVRSSPELH